MNPNDRPYCNCGACHLCGLLGKAPRPTPKVETEQPEEKREPTIFDEPVREE